MNEKVLAAGRCSRDRWMLLLSGLAMAVSLLPAAPSNAGCRAQSGPGQAALIELYTSEGCSSCPPADRWLTDLAAEPSARGEVVPLALHVDYWDGLGWRDRFARPDFSARQRALTAAQGSKTVFTPQVMVNGRTALDWREDAAFRRRIAAINARPAEAELDLEIAPDADAWRVWVRGRLQPRAAVDRAGVFVALYQNGLFSHVTAGENAARRLRHDRVTRELVGPLPVAADGGFAHPHRFRPPADADPRDLGIAAFVQDRADGHVWQALALVACPE